MREIRHQKRINITTEIVNNAKERHREKELLLYVTMLMKKDRLKNPEIIESCIQMTEEKLHTSSMSEQSSERIQQKIRQARQQSAPQAEKTAWSRIWEHMKRQRWELAVRFALVMGILFLVNPFWGGEAQARMLRKLEVHMRQEENGEMIITIEGDSTEKSLPADMEELWKELQVPQRYTYWKTKNHILSNSATIYFALKEDPTSYIAIEIRLYTADIEESRVGAFYEGNYVYSEGRFTYYTGQNADGNQQCMWTDSPYFSLVTGDLTEQEIWEVVHSCQRAMEKRSTE